MPTQPPPDLTDTAAPVAGVTSLSSVAEVTTAIWQTLNNWAGSKKVQ